MMTDANQIYCNDHFVIHTNIKSLHFIPETNICQLQKKKKHRKQTNQLKNWEKDVNRHQRRYADSKQ